MWLGGEGGGCKPFKLSFLFDLFLAYCFHSRFTVPLLSGQPLQSFTSLAACTLVLKYITWEGSSLVSSAFKKKKFFEEVQKHKEVEIGPGM